MQTEERQLNNYHTLPLNAKQNKQNEQTNKTKQINKMLYKISKNKL